MLETRFLRTLDVLGATGNLNVRHLSAASGLVRIGQRLFVVADDELSLGEFDLSNVSPGHLHRLFDGELPSHHRERKVEKPDLEALTALPALSGHPFGALLAVGSGSKPNRQRAVLLGLDRHGAVDGSVHQVDLAPLYKPLRAQFPDLNIEGLFVAAGALNMLQRGNRTSPVNACIRFRWPEIEPWLRGEAPAPRAESVAEFNLGNIDGVPLCFTDGTAIPGGGWAFCAAAEDTSDSYTDGRCKGSAVGVVNARGKLVLMEPIAGTWKAEGIAVANDTGPLDLLLVTDADDRRAAAQMLSVTLSTAWLVQGSGSGETDL